MNDYCQFVFPHQGKDIRMATPHMRQVFATIRNLIRHYDTIGGVGARYGPINQIVDVGGCVGSWAIVYALLFPEAKILVLEPSKYNYEYLEFNCKAFPNIETMKIAAHNKKGTLSLAGPHPLQRNKPDYNTNTGLISVYGASDNFVENVRADKLDNLIANKVDYLKIDVEGHEMPVLQGAQRILLEDRPVLQVECREATQQMAGRALAELIELISDARYGIVTKLTADMVFMPLEKL